MIKISARVEGVVMKHQIQRNQRLSKIKLIINTHWENKINVFFCKNNLTAKENIFTSVKKDLNTLMQWVKSKQQ